MKTVLIWLLLTVPPDPLDTRVLDTYSSRDKCEERQLMEHFRNRWTVCMPLSIPAKEG